MQITTTYECPECGFIWRHGHNGSHNCATRLKARVKELESTPDLWAESVKTADEMGDKITYDEGKYIIWNEGYELGPFTLPELHEKLKELSNETTN